MDRTLHTLRHPHLGTGPVSAEPYYSQHWFDRERDTIFRATWLNLCREEELPAPGNFLVREIEICKTSVLLVRDKDGRVRAFHNICAHRGNRLVLEESGKIPAFVCRYHAWTYGLDGALKKVPGEESFFDLDRDACGLIPIAYDSWRGFVFINLAENPPPLLDYLGDFTAFAEGYPFERCTAPVVMRYDLNANWKIACDAFQETYHLGYLHRKTTRNMYASNEDSAGNFLSIDLYGPHRRYSAWANPEYVTPENAKVERFVGTLGRNINAGAQGGKDGPSVIDLCPGINPTRDTRWCWDNSFVFPNMVLTLAPEVWIISRFWPLAIDRTRWENITYYPAPANASQRFLREFGFAHLRDVAAEDVETMEGSTCALQSGAKKQLHLQDGEIGVRHMLHSVEEYVNGASA